MKLLPLFATAALFAASVPAMAQDASAPASAVSSENLRKGRLVISADGRRIGRIEMLVGDRAAPSAVRIISNGKFVTVPTETLSVGDRPNTLKTTLNYKEVR